jgi:hypothetical protein
LSISRIIAPNGQAVQVSSFVSASRLVAVLAIPRSEGSSAGLAINRQEAFSLRQNLPQGVECLAEVAVGLRFARIRPEEESQALASVGDMRMEQEIGKQRLLAGLIETTD